MRVIGEHRDNILGVTCAPDEKHIVSASFNDHVLLWGDGKKVGQFGVGRGCVCWMGSMSSTGVLAAGFGDCTVQLWENGKRQQLVHLNGIVASLDWSADGKRLLTGNCGDNTVRLWDAESGDELACGKTKRSATWFVVLSRDGKTALSGAGDKLVHVWEIESGREVGALTGHTGKILALSFARDGIRAASASQDRTARIWNVKLGTEVSVLAGHRKQVVAVALSQDGELAATASTDRTVRIWNASSGTEAGRFVLNDPPSSVAWLKGELIVATGRTLMALGPGDFGISQ